MAMVEMMRTKTLEGRSASIRRSRKEDSLNLLSKRRLSPLLATSQGGDLSNERAAAGDERMRGERKRLDSLVSSSDDNTPAFSRDDDYEGVVSVGSRAGKDGTYE